MISQQLSTNHSSSKTVLITGTTSGIGKEAAYLFAKRSWNLILINRNSSRLEQFKKKFQANFPQVAVSYYMADFFDLNQVKIAAHEVLANHTRLDAIVNNVGLIDRTGIHELPNGLEPHIGVNYMSNVLLTLLLKPILGKDSKVVMVTSEVHKIGRLNSQNNGASWLQRYANSKLCINLFSNYIASDWSETGVNVNTIHPGVVGTSIFFNKGWTRQVMAPLVGIFMKSSTKAAEEYYQLVTRSEFIGMYGEYFKNDKLAIQGKRALDKELQQSLYSWTMDYFKKHHLI